ncbi:hypothetical protein ACH42_10290 [Endozoicomonas sp. (ex Bugula neritina AB1)]|nr:hypothetical protein ACH42_10290 [Endozoicomonas sp. (ex Bugula neritina AB1)]
MTVSLLDALLEHPGSQDITMASKQSVIDNIRLLLESRQCQTEVVSGYPLVESALYGFGLSSRYLNRSHYQGNCLCREIEQQIKCYEPRLNDVVVEMVQLNEQSNCIHFRIDGVLQTDTEKVPVGFDSVLNLTDTRLNIEEMNVV